MTEIKAFGIKLGRYTHHIPDHILVAFIGNGKLLFPNKNYLLYSDLGVVAWMDIQEDEIEMMLKDCRELFEQDENRELIITLEVYLDCKMNYSPTAKKLFVHINTVRKRINQIYDKIQLDLDEPSNRLKLEILLKLLDNFDLSQ